MTPARRRRRRPGDDRGAVLPFVALMLVVLVGMGALVIDVGALYQERRELQNGADAAALAVAKDCAEGDCGATDTPAGLAEAYASDNATDLDSDIGGICGNGPGLVACGATPEVPEGASGWVKVTTQTNGQIDYVLAPVFGLDGKTVEASAVAAWGPVGQATTIPLIFSVCEFTEFGGTLDPLTYPPGPHTVFFHDTQQDGPAENCPAGPSGADLPGGFGWLGTSSDCKVAIVDDWVADNPGNFNPSSIDCNPTTWQNAKVLLPLFDETNGLTGSNGEYHVAGFVGFRILGYKFSGWEWWAPDVDPRCKGQERCIYGEFTEITTTGGEFGEGPDYGARIVRMIG